MNFTGNTSTGDKVSCLSNPAAYPHSPERVDVVETHMSWVFLAGEIVYKLKKPVYYDFLDFSTLKTRHEAVLSEIRLNRRLAEDVYLGFKALRQTGNGELTLEDHGEIVDWLVVMRRLPDDQSLEAAILNDALTPGDVSKFEALLCDFYASLPPETVRPDDYVGRFDLEIGRIVEVLTDPQLQFGCANLEQVLSDFAVNFEQAKMYLAQRAKRGHIVEGHGDLRPQHIFLTDPPVIIDCLEFNRDLRLVDPFDEVAFLGMECALLGESRVFPSLVDGLASALGEVPSPALLAFYWRYRALLRARLSLLHIVHQPNRTPGKWRPLAQSYVALAAEHEVMNRMQAVL
ncbi:hypothetical protein [Ovoidimarina sediminis]|uniref:hypothetical protein n=1 Tax=Ovoidimarina sediminis TaxID=3079856 RepID=UPI00290A0FC1|nr:hypothetical protein [Rhodophyticola sp. MJ-SS7]MDU8945795.1 hypothetical protein [Rhodophyticola sp. MJ-SS7]